MNNKEFSRRDLIIGLKFGGILLRGGVLSSNTKASIVNQEHSRFSRFDILDHIENPERDPYLSGIKQTELDTVGLENRKLSPITGLTVNREDFSEADAYKQLDRLGLNLFSRLEQMPSYYELENNLLGIIEVPSVNRESLLASRLRNGEDVVVEAYGVDLTNPKKEVELLQFHAKDGWGIRAVDVEGIITLEEFPDNSQKRGVTFTKGYDGRLMLDIFHADESFQSYPEYRGLRTWEKSMSVALGKDVYESLVVLIFTKGSPILWEMYKDSIEEDKEIWGNSEMGYSIPDLAVPIVGTYWPQYGDFIGPTPLQVVAKKHQE